MSVLTLQTYFWISFYWALNFQHSLLGAFEAWEHKSCPREIGSSYSPWWWQMVDFWRTACGSGEESPPQDCQSKTYLLPESSSCYLHLSQRREDGTAGVSQIALAFMPPVHHDCLENSPIWAPTHADDSGAGTQRQKACHKSGRRLSWRHSACCCKSWAT